MLLTSSAAVPQPSSPGRDVATVEVLRAPLPAFGFVPRTSPLEDVVVTTSDDLIDTVPELPGPTAASAQAPTSARPAMSERLRPTALHHPRPRVPSAFSTMTTLLVRCRARSDRTQFSVRMERASAQVCLRGALAASGDDAVALVHRGSLILGTVRRRPRSRGPGAAGAQVSYEIRRSPVVGLDRQLLAIGRPARRRI